jgi:predicted enzyme related to lactoylglutathione lyase
MKANPVVWFEIYVENMERAKTFYEAVLQCKLEHLQAPDTEKWDMWSFPMSEEGYGAGGALAKMEGCSPGHGGGTLVYFRCEDCAEEAARAANNGGRVFKEKMPIGKYGFIALVYDTEGNMIGLHSMK